MREVILPTGEPLIGERVRLDVMAESDVDEMCPLLADPQVYENGYVMHRCPTSAEDGRTLVTGLFLGRPGRITYAIRLAGDGPLGRGGTLVGTSSLMDADLGNERIHIGATFYGRRWWGTAVNPATKLLLLTHCFDDCGYGRVKIQTDALNTRSQAAIAKLGAQREGVLRRHMRREDGTFRDTVVFSILADEWQAVRSELQRRLVTPPSDGRAAAPGR